MQNKELPFLKEMFESIAPKYDFLNRTLSLRQDLYWRRVLAFWTDIPINGKVLDIACGTGDVSIEIFRQKGPDVHIFGIDFSERMLFLAREKIKKLSFSSNIHLLAGNALNLPFKSETFNAATIAFGIRNITDKLSALKSFYKCLKPGGMLLVLELATPKKGLLLSLYLFYFKIILPLIGWFFSRNIKAYNYLPASVINFPDAETFAAIMHQAGFSNIKWKKLTIGIAVLFIGYKKTLPPDDYPAFD